MPGPFDTVMSEEMFKSQFAMRLSDSVNAAMIDSSPKWKRRMRGAIVHTARNYDARTTRRVVVVDGKKHDYDTLMGEIRRDIKVERFKRNKSRIRAMKLIARGLP